MTDGGLTFRGGLVTDLYTESLGDDIVSARVTYMPLLGKMTPDPKSGFGPGNLYSPEKTVWTNDAEEIRELRKQLET